MNREAYIQLINELLQQCADTDLLDLVYKILLQESSNQTAEIF